jgi:signal peptidase
MNPLLRSGDALDVEPYGATPIRRGDVIVFPHPFEQRNIVHRVIAKGPEGYKTRGDNNNQDDPYWVAREAVIGRVAARVRGKRSRPLRGGAIGLLLHRVFLTRRWFIALAYKFAHPIYHSIAKLGLFHGWLRPFVTPKIARFQREQGVEIQLLVKGRMIARRQPGKEKWETRFPYALFLSEKDFPRD